MSSRSLRAASFAWLLGACSAGPYYVEKPLTRSSASPDEKPPEVRVVPARAPTVISKGLPNRMTARVVERVGTGFVSLVYTNRRARLGTDYLPVFVGDALLAGARHADGRVIHPVALDGSEPSVHTSEGGTTISIDCTPERFEEALELIASLVQRPLFDPTWMARVRSRTQLDLAHIRGRYWSWTLATEHADQPFYVSAESIAERLRGVDQAALARSHRALFRAEESALIVVGDLAPARVFSAFERQFSDWRDPADSKLEPMVGTNARAAAPSSKRSSRKILVYEDQTYPEITVVQDAPSADSPDAVPFALLQAVLTGNRAFGLMNALRYDRAHAYWAGARTVSVPERGTYLFVRTSVAAETLPDDLAVMLHTLGNIRVTPVDRAALAGAKAKFNADFAAGLASTSGIVSYLAEAELLGSPSIAELQANFERVTPEEIRRVAERYLDPDHATVVVRGAVAGALPGLGRLGVVTTSD